MEPQRKPSGQKQESERQAAPLAGWLAGWLYLRVVHEEAHTLGAGVEVNPEVLQLLVVGRKQLQDGRAQGQKVRKSASQHALTWVASRKAVRQGKVYTLTEKQAATGQTRLPSSSCQHQAPSLVSMETVEEVEEAATVLRDRQVRGFQAATDRLITGCPACQSPLQSLCL